MLEQPLKILTLQQSGSTWSWEITHETWGGVELTNARNVFSQVALAARTAELTLRAQPLTLRNAVRWDSKTLYITQIDEGDDRHHLKVTTALLEPVAITLHRETHGLDERRRPAVTATADYTFPAWITEKYMGRAQQDPAVAVETTYVLIVPKAAIELRDGETVQIGHKAFVVLLAHTLDPDRNEYEVLRSEEA